MNFLCEQGTELINMEEIRFYKAYEEIKSLNEDLAIWLWNKRAISYERFWEIGLAGLKQGVKWSNIKGMDHSDGTEVKTLRYSWDTSNGGCWTGTVGNTNTKTGNMKIVIYNPLRQEFCFVFLTNKEKNAYSNASGRGSLKFTFPKYKEPNGWWVKYVVPFEQFVKL